MINIEMNFARLINLSILNTLPGFANSFTCLGNVNVVCRHLLMTCVCVLLQSLLNQLRAVFDQIIEFQNAQDTLYRSALEELQLRVQYEDSKRQREQEVQKSKKGGSVLQSAKHFTKEVYPEHLLFPW